MAEQQIGTATNGSPARQLAKLEAEQAERGTRRFNGSDANCPGSRRKGVLSEPQDARRPAEAVRRPPASAG